MIKNQRSDTEKNNLIEDKKLLVQFSLNFMHEMKVIQKFNGYSLKTLFYTESSVVCEDLFL